MINFGTLVATFIAGLLSFVAPCTVPLLPAYLACVSGVSAANLNDPEQRGDFRGRLLLGSMLYVLGFTVVFVLGGIGAGHIGSGLRNASRGLEIGGGVLLVGFGLLLSGVLGRVAGLRWMQRQRRFQLPGWLARRGVLAAVPIGVVFGLAWTPCVGPYLGSALALAALSGHALSGAALLASYSLGLGIPFVAMALLWASLPELPRRLNRLSGPLTRIGGAMTAVLGTLVATGAYTHLTSWLVQFSVPR